MCHVHVQYEQTKFEWAGGRRWVGGRTLSLLFSILILAYICFLAFLLTYFSLMECGKGTWNWNGMDGIVGRVSHGKGGGHIYISMCTVRAG
ncbi:hypothetical protein BDZ91DRAFT_729861 [Kalaharituber pfeilii]|nr:hypothetical protein BDZ91DRAFT_729861 [Kalaharituber pfeilii]